MASGDRMARWIDKVDQRLHRLENRRPQGSGVYSYTQIAPDSLFYSADNFSELVGNTSFSIVNTAYLSVAPITLPDGGLCSLAVGEEGHYRFNATIKVEGLGSSDISAVISAGSAGIVAFDGGAPDSSGSVFLNPHGTLSLPADGVASVSFDTSFGFGTGLGVYFQEFTAEWMGPGVPAFVAEG